MFSIPYNTPTLVISLFGYSLEITFYGFAKGFQFYNNKVMEERGRL